MAKRINITIPDSLHKRLQKVKDKLNVSETCQKAIEIAVYSEELLQDIEKGLETAGEKLNESSELGAWVEELKAEKTLFDEKTRHNGFKDAFDDALQLSYEQIIDILYNGVHPYLASDELEELISSRVENFDLDIYLEGWIDGLEKLFEKIADKL